MNRGGFVITDVTEYKGCFISICIKSYGGYYSISKRVKGKIYYLETRVYNYSPAKDREYLLYRAKSWIEMHNTDKLLAEMVLKDIL